MTARRCRTNLPGGPTLLALCLAVLADCSAPPAAPSAAGGAAPTGKPSILLVSIDTLRADHVGCFGDRNAATPNLDRWAAEGVLFEHAATPVPITLPAHATLLTGRLPHRHGLRDNGIYRLPEDVPTLAEGLVGAGYATAAVVGAVVLDRQYGIARGFQRYDDAIGGERSLAIAERPAGAVTDAALRAARGLQSPYFLFVHYYDPHAAYAPPPPFDERFRSRPYDGEVAYVDEQLGRLRTGLEALGLLRDTVVVLTADHGEGLGEHGEEAHGVFLYQSTLHVPLVVAAPGRWPAGRRVASPVSLADVTPTLLELAGATIPGDSDGRSLTPAVTGPGLPPRWLPLETELGYNSYGWAPLTGLSDGTLKWVGAPEPELYDLTEDPREERNQASTRAADLQRLEGLWRQAVREDRRGRPVVDASDREAAERQERLASLGYVAGSPGAGAPPRGSLPDPKRAIGSLASINQARQLIGQKRFDEAAALLAGVLRQSPRNLSALVLTGSCRLLQGRPALALEPLRRATRLAPTNADAHFNLGLACLGTGDGRCAEAAFRRALALEPRRAEAAANLVDLLLQLGRPAEAQKAFAEARAAGAASPLLDYLEGKLALARGEREAGRSALQRALQGGLPPAVAADAQARLRAAER